MTLRTHGMTMTGRMVLGAAIAAALNGFGSGSVFAAGDDQAQIDALKQENALLQRLLAELAKRQAASEAKIDALARGASPAAGSASAPAAVAADMPATPAQPGDKAHGFFELKDGKGVTFYVPHGELSLYANLDVSVDEVAKNVGSTPVNYAASPPVGNWGWMPDISTNLAYLGARGFQTLGPDTSFKFIYQFEAGIDIAATPGLKETNSSESNTVNGALFSRNSFLGFASPQFGAVKVGKTDAPYKQSTISLNPFLGELGDNGAIMGNTGGDSRVEFGTRLDHSIWYESPNVNGFALNLLFSPGQNRDDDSGDLAAGESDCTGGNIPESGADLPALCNDGAWNNAFSGSLTYTAGPLYVVAASELHQHVNRQSDISGAYGTGAVLPTPYSQKLYNQDVANEWAAKLGIQYVTATKTTLGAIIEYMQRDEAQDLQFQNERTRYGAWLVAGQALTAADSIYFGWAHAFHTPGDPGQHNDATIPTPDGLSSYATNQNKADLFTIALKHRVTDDLLLYTDWAMLDNGPSAHYALGAGGRGVVTDCHDASDAPGGADSNPHCYTGQTIMGISAGVKYSF